MSKNKVLRLEIIGIFLIIVFGTTLHFWFEWTGYWRPIAIVAAVNESTWEHFKMAFWPGLIFAIIEYPFIKDQANNFLLAKALGLLTMPVVTTVLFYGYTSITGHHYLLADVIIFIVSVIAGQLVSLKILNSPKTYPRGTRPLAGTVVVLMTLAFSLLSYYPFENFLFEHPEGGEYGILEDYHDH